MLEKTVWYLENLYPYSSDVPEYTAMVEELTAAVEASSITAVTKQIRELHSCPKIVKLTDTGQYTFHSCAKKVSVEWEEIYISRLGFANGWGDYVRTSDTTASGAYIFIDANEPRYPDSEGRRYYLYRWILYGNICEECGAHYVDFDGSPICNTCQQQYNTHEYNAQADQILGREETTETLFGIELEYEDITSVQVGKSLKGHAISKRDGSIRHGVEVVTRPACIATHKKSLQPFYDTVKVAAASNTGMHVHVDKSKLSNYQIGFMMEFLNKTELLPDIEKIAGRSYSTNTYCASDKAMKMSWGNKFDEASYRHIRTKTGKYSPLNTAKEQTIEVRIFSSPESFEEMSAKLDFVAALVKYSSPYAVSVKSLKDKFLWPTFIRFVTVNKKEFPHFVSHFLKD